jgi:hypothetical protein
MISDMLHNYIISYTSGVFESSYQTRRIRKDPTQLAFEHKAGENDALLRSLRNISLSRDTSVPINPAKEDLFEFNRRRNVAATRARIEIEYLAGKGDRKEQIVRDN